MAATATTLATMATVAQLVQSVHGLVTKITRAAETARQNKLECRNLACRVSVIGELLQQLQDPGVAQPLAGLGVTLQEAHDLVLACQKWSARRKFLYADDQAERFREVNRRIDSHLILIPLLSHISVTRRLDQILPPSPTSVLLPVAPTMVAASGTVPSPGSGSSRSSPQMQGSAAVQYAAVEFSSAEIAFLTGNFGHVLSEDGSGTVYKGRLHDGQEVAVKSLKTHGRQRHEQEGAFVAEIEILCQLRHDHIVRLVGWCAEDDDRMFVYNYQHTSNGTLRDHLHGGGSATPSPVMSSWKARIQALLGASRAIDHVHRVANPRIIHRNVSSSSIHLDETWAPRLSGFDAAILQEPATGGQLVGEVAGMSGYVDPEYSRTRRVSPMSDVYSLGVVTLEVLTGRPASWAGTKDPNALAGFAVPIIDSGNLVSVLDRRPSPATSGKMEALELVAYTAARCLWPEPQDRPSMSNVVANLETALGLIDGDEPKRHYWS